MIRDPFKETDSEPEEPAGPTIQQAVNERARFLTRNQKGKKKRSFSKNRDSIRRSAIRIAVFRGIEDPLEISRQTGISLTFVRKILKSSSTWKILKNRENPAGSDNLTWEDPKVNPIGRGSDG